jgi:hypothetical protein
MNLDGLVTAIDRLARLLVAAEDNAEQWRARAAQLESENQALRAEAEKWKTRNGIDGVTSDDSNNLTNNLAVT